MTKPNTRPARAESETKMDKRYTVTNYIARLPNPLPPTDQKAPMTLQSFDNLDEAVDFFLMQCKTLDTGCVQLWDAGIETGHLHI